MSIVEPVSPTWYILLLVGASCLAFVLLWIFVVWLLALFSGWKRLAERYSATAPAQGDVHRGSTLLLGRSRYRNAITVTTSSQGVHLSPMWLFRVGHSPLFIPWRELSNPRPTSYRRQPLVLLDVGIPPLTTVSLPSAVLEQEPAAAARLQASRAPDVP